MAHDQNLKKWQLTIQNPEVVDAERSDAHRHAPEYCVATALMGTPLFMALPRHYRPQARERIARLLGVYTRHRRRIFDSVVFPVGDEPSHAGWCGFQAVSDVETGGYLTVFRERLNPDPTREIGPWHVAAGTRLRITDLLHDREWVAVTGARGALRLEIHTPGDFHFLRYAPVAGVRRRPAGRTSPHPREGLPLPAPPGARPAVRRRAR